MTTHYVSTLGVAKCREILKGMPEGATLFFCFTRSFENRVDYYKHFYSYFQMWLVDHGWFPVHPDLTNDACSIVDLRNELSAYDTDSCTDIHNHISPNTKVIDHG